MSKLNPALLVGLMSVITSTQFTSSARAATAFVLGGEALPNSAEIVEGDKQVAQKEQIFLANIGIDSDVSQRPRTNSGPSGKYIYTDSDVM